MYKYTRFMIIDDYLWRYVISCNDMYTENRENSTYNHIHIIYTLLGGKYGQSA